MARKTLGKMEFESLVKSLQEQNKGHIAAQQETTKSIRNLQAYFIKQDRADMRRRLEQGLEEKREAEKVVGGSSKGKGLSKIPTKGLLGRFMDFILTGALGTAGKGIFRSMWSGVKFGGGFFKGLAGLMGGLILAPTIWESITKGFESYEKDKDIANAIDTSISTFFDKAGFFGAVGAGALSFGMFGGPRGAIAGALVFGSLSAVKSALGEDTTLGDFFTGNAGKFESALSGAALGAVAGFTQGAKFGLKGAVAGLLIGAGLGAIGGLLVSKDTNINAFSIMTSVLGGFAGGMLGLKAGAMLGAVGGPVGMIAGALLGAAIGLALGSLATEESKAEKAIKEMAQKGARIKELSAKSSLSKDEQAELAQLNKDVNQQIVEEGFTQDNITRAAMAASDGDMNKMRTVVELVAGKEIPEQLKRLSEILGIRLTKLSDYFEFGNQGFNLLLKKDLKTKNPLGKDVTYRKGELLDTVVAKQGGDYMVHSDPIERNIQNRFITLPAEHPIRKEMQEMSDRGDDDVFKVHNKYLDELASFRRGFGAFTRPQLIQVGDQPTSQGQELVFTEKKFNQIISDIIDNNRLKQERDAMMAMIPAMTSQGGGGTSMPVINNSYSYQNTENTVREMPTTSSLNMMTALA